MNLERLIQGELIIDAHNLHIPIMFEPGKDPLYVMKGVNTSAQRYLYVWQEKMSHVGPKDYKKTLKLQSGKDEWIIQGLFPMQSSYEHFLYELHYDYAIKNRNTLNH